ncbi:MAG: hypothetical protein P4M08_14910 [Oligoflexia bacterium]|nr:hypothetical protein [Oligoflexia bacterium]
MNFPDFLFSVGLLFAVEAAAVTSASAAATPAPPDRAASVYVSEDFINEQLAVHVKSELLQKMSIRLDPEQGQVFLRGVLHMPTEELRALKLDPKLVNFVFQVAVRMSSTKAGHLILQFPLNETYLYPLSSKNHLRDRVIIPVQMLSLALASARGYFAALSGDFSGFDRREERLRALIREQDRAIAVEKKPDTLDELKTRREALRIQLEAVPVERKQLKILAKQVESVMGFTGERELDLNQDLAAFSNALIFKIKLSQLAPYLKGVELSGVRIVHDKKDGRGENYLAIDLNTDLSGPVPASAAAQASGRPGLKTAPSLVVRLNQSLFESEAVLNAEKKGMGSSIRDFSVRLKDDGLHVSGKWHRFFFSIPFETVVDFVSTGADVFEARLRKMDVAGIDFKFLTQFVLEALKLRLDQSLKGICTFDYAGQDGAGTRSLRVTVDPKALVPAFPSLHLVGVDVREREFLLKVGTP